MKKLKKIFLMISIFFVSVVSIFCVSLKVKASSRELTIDITEQDLFYSFVFNINDSLQTGILLKCDYSVMGNPQNTKNLIVYDDDIIFNFVNGDSTVLPYFSDAIYVYGIDKTYNKEYYGFSREYDYENNTPIFSAIHEHNASYTQYQITSFIINPRGMIKYNYSGNIWGSTLAYATQDFTETINEQIMQGYILNSSHAFAYDSEQNGYTNGYYAGLQDGEEGKSPLTRVWEIIGGVFNAVANVMSIELFPSIPVGIFFLVPLVFGAVGFIFWIWKRGG